MADHPPLKVTKIKWRDGRLEEFAPPRAMDHLPHSNDVVFVDYFTEGDDHHYCAECFPNRGRVVDERRAPKA